jgi:Family of unknown function (DUF6062)
MQIGDRFVPDTIMRGEFLRLADQPGCVACHAAHAAVDRFFAWYRIEQYHEPSIIRRMQEERGFCPEHTRQFLATSSSHLVSTVYLDLLASASTLLKSLGRESSALPEVLADRLRPQVACLACERRETAVDGIASVLHLVLTDEQVRDAISRPSALCLPHFLHLLPSLDWEVAQLLAHTQLTHLQAACEEYHIGTESTRFVRMLVGTNADEPLLSQQDSEPMVGPADERAEDALIARGVHGMVGSDNVPGQPSSWSPALDRLDTLLAEPGCPLCREEQATAATYLGWLSEELSARTSSKADEDARLLCLRHLWHFLLIGDDKAVEGLLRSAFAYWTGMVQALTSGLDRPPPTSFVARSWHGMQSALHRTPRVTYWRAFWEGIAEGRRSQRKRLAELREPPMHTRQCPACRFQSEHAERLADLLERALCDAGMARRYDGSSGVCFRHLPLAIRRCTETSTIKLLLRTQYTRIAVVHWELEEYWRKLNWTRRWEPKGDEQTAWYRAVTYYSGTDVTR